MHSSTLPLTGARVQQDKAVLPAIFALLFGVFLVFGVGFAGAQSIHDAAHDARHAFAFPCH